MSELPEGWASTRLEDLCDPSAPIIYGILQPGPEQTDGVPYVRPTEIVDDQIDVAQVRRTTNEIARKYRRAMLRPRDVLLSIVGTIGKVAVVPAELDGANITQSSVRIRPGAHTTPEFIRACLKGPQLRAQFDAKRLGTGVPRLNVGDVRQLEIQLPPLPEQRRIVAKLDSLQSKSRRAKEALDAIPPLLERFRKATLAAAFRGDLTAEWRAKNPEVEPASELLKRIRVERRKRWEEAELAKMQAKGKEPGDDRWKAKYQEPEPVDTEGLPELPEGWCWAAMDEVADLVTGGTPPGKEEGCYGGDIAFLKPTDLEAGKHVVSARQHLTSHGASFLQVLPEGSVLITCIGATIGKTGLARVRCATNQQINAAVPILIHPEFLYWFMVGPLAQEWITSNASATTLPILNKGRLSRMPIPIAPLGEQNVLRSRLAQHSDCWASALRAVVSSVAELAQSDRAILAKAFRGELVPQDPSDEPASTLLARIAAERDSAPAAKPKRVRRAG